MYLFYFFIFHYPLKKTFQICDSTVVEDQGDVCRAGDNLCWNATASPSRYPALTFIPVNYTIWNGHWMPGMAIENKGWVAEDAARMYIRGSVRSRRPYLTDAVVQVPASHREAPWEYAETERPSSYFRISFWSSDVMRNSYSTLLSQMETSSFSTTSRKSVAIR